MKYLASQVRSSLIRRLFILFLILSIIGCCFSVLAPSYRNLFSNNQVVTSDFLQTSTNLQRLEFTQKHYQPDYIYATGEVEVKQKYLKSMNPPSDNERSWYYVMQFGEQFILLKSKPNEFLFTQEKPILSGTLRPLDYRVGVSANDRAVMKILQAHPQLQDGKLNSNVIVYTKSKTFINQGALLILAIFMLVFIRFLYLLWLYWKPQYHFGLKSLVKHYQLNLEELSAQLEAEYQQGLLIERKGIQIYQHYIGMTGQYEYQLIPLEKLLYLYTEEKGARLFAVKSPRKIMHFFETNRKIKVPIYNQNEAMIMATIEERYPNIVLGYDRKLVKMIKRSSLQFIEYLNNKRGK